MELSIKKKVNRIGVAGQVVSIILIVLMAVACWRSCRTTPSHSA